MKYKILKLQVHKLQILFYMKKIENILLNIKIQNIIKVNLLFKANYKINVLVNGLLIYLMIL